MNACIGKNGKSKICHQRPLRGIYLVRLSAVFQRDYIPWIDRDSYFNFERTGKSILELAHSESGSKKYEQKLLCHLATVLLGNWSIRMKVSSSILGDGE